MKNSKFAVLDQKQIQEIKQLEEKLEVTLLAYDQSVNEGNNVQNQNEDSVG